MKTAIFYTALFGMLGLSPEYASAQQDYATRMTNNGTPVIYDHASTVIEGYLRGMADLVRAWGDYDYERSLAVINFEEAKRRWLNNKSEFVRTYYALRQVYQDARDEQLRKRRSGLRYTEDDMVPAIFRPADKGNTVPTSLRAEDTSRRFETPEQRINRLAKDAAPDRLTPLQYDPVTRTLNWPRPLERSVFDVQRQEVDRLIAERDEHNSGMGTENCQQLRNAVDRLRGKMIEQLRRGNIAPAEHTVIYQFLNSLKYEAIFVPTVNQLASR